MMQSTQAPPEILTFDIGTSSCKAALFTAEGQLLSVGRGSYGIRRLPGGRVEQDPAEILEGVREALADLRGQGFALRQIRVISFSAQMAAHCLVDANGEALSPIISWMDQRAMPQVSVYAREFTPADTLRLTGFDMVITPAHTITKLRWMRENMAPTLARAQHLAQVKDLLIHELTGEWVSDPTSLKGMVNQDTCEPIPEILRFTGCDASLLPRVLQPYEIAGRLRPNVRGFEDLAPGIPVVTGWNDMNAACLGLCGLPESSTGFDLTGTSEHFGIVAAAAGGKGATCDGINRVPFLCGREVYYGVTSSGGQALDWYMHKIFAGGGYDELLNSLDGVERAEVKDLFFLPYIEGERNPWNIPGGRGAFFGLSARHDRLHLAWAVMEGVCFALRTIADRMPVRPEYCAVAGGAARVGAWNRMKADCLGVEYRRLHTTEAGCNGAAILAMHSLAPETPIAEIAQKLTRTVERCAPDGASRDYYDEKYRRFLRLKECLVDKFEGEDA